MSSGSAGILAGDRHYTGTITACIQVKKKRLPAVRRKKSSSSHICKLRVIFVRACYKGWSVVFWCTESGILRSQRTRYDLRICHSELWVLLIFCLYPWAQAWVCADSSWCCRGCGWLVWGTASRDSQKLCKWLGEKGYEKKDLANTSPRAFFSAGARARPLWTVIRAFKAWFMKTKRSLHFRHRTCAGFLELQ